MTTLAAWFIGSKTGQNNKQFLAGRLTHRQAVAVISVSYDAHCPIQMQRTLRFRAPCLEKTLFQTWMLLFVKSKHAHTHTENKKHTQPTGSVRTVASLGLTCIVFVYARSKFAIQFKAFSPVFDLQEATCGPSRCM